MKRTYKSIILLFSLIVVTTIGFSESGVYDWVKDYIVLRRSEKVTRDAEGVAQVVDRVTTSKVTISQTLSEREVRGKDGNLSVVSRSRVTVTTDTNGSVTTVQEKEDPIGTGLKVVSVVTNEKTPTGSIATVKTRGKHGELAINSRSTVSKGLDGVTVTTVEKPDKDGNLVVREESSSE